MDGNGIEEWVFWDWVTYYGWSISFVVNGLGYVVVMVVLGGLMSVLVGGYIIEVLCYD